MTAPPAEKLIPKTPAAPPAPPVVRYPYIGSELIRISILTVIMLAILFGTAWVMHRL